MVARDTDSLDHLPDEGPVAPETPERFPSPSPSPSVTRTVEPVLVDVNYPDPTLLSEIVRDVARWSDQSFVMEPSVNVKLQIFAPRRLPRDDAYALFLASLSVVSLRAVQIGRIVKIVPVSLVVSA